MWRRATRFRVQIFWHAGPDGTGGFSARARVHSVVQDTPPSSAWTMSETQVGTWLSLVERTLGVGEVASSNLVVPTITFNYLAVADRPRGSKRGSIRVQ